jgi:hypothetical protein
LLPAIVALCGLLLATGCQDPVATQPLSGLRLQDSTVSSGQPFELEVSGAGLSDSARAVLTRDLGHRHQVKSVLRLWGTVVGVMLQDEFAYVANNTKGLVVVDISDPDAPEVAASLSLSGRTLKVLPHGNLLIAANEASGVQLVDISDPTRPSLISSLVAPGRIFDLDQSGSLVFAAAGKEGLLILDISNQEHPVVLSKLGLPGRSLAIRQVGHTVYLAGTEVLAAVDVSDPRHPVLLDSTPLEHNGFSIDAYADKLLVALGSKGVLVVDISRPGQLRIIDQLRSLGHVVRISVDAGRAYLASTFGTLVLDLAAGPVPVLLGGMMGNNRVSDVASRNGIVWATDTYSGLEVLDLRQPEAFGFARLPGPDQQVLQVTSSGQRLVNLQTNEDQLAYSQIEARTLNLLDNVPESSRQSIFVSDGNAAVQQGTRVYLGTNQGLLSLDLSNPARLGVLSRNFEDVSIVDLARAGDILYAAAGESGLLILRLTDGVPELIGHAPSQGFASGVAVAGNFVYLSAQQAGLEIFNVSDSSKPLPMASMRYPYPLDEFSQTADVALYQGMAYVADGPNGLMVVDVRDPYAPVLVALVKTEDYARRVAIRDRRLYLTDSRGGVRIYDITQPDRPIFVSCLRFPISTQACVVTGDTIGIALRHTGILWVEDPVEATAARLLDDGSVRFRFPPIRQPGEYNLRVFNDAGGEELPGIIVINATKEGG